MNEYYAFLTYSGVQRIFEEGLSQNISLWVKTWTYYEIWIQLMSKFVNFNFFNTEFHWWVFLFLQFPTCYIFVLYHHIQM